MVHHLSQAAQQASGSTAWEAVDCDVDVFESQSKSRGTAEQHIALDGTSLTDEQRFAAELQVVEDSIKSEVTGLGEVLLQLSGSRSVVSGDLSPEQHAVLVERIKAVADEVEADATFISSEITGPSPVPVSEKNGGKGSSKTNCHSSSEQPTQQATIPASAPTDAATEQQPSAILVRRRTGGGRMPLELRVAVIGNVDSGKSTMVGVLTRGVLDNGRGAARSKVFKHSHEDESGRTSAIGQHNLCLDSKGKILNDVSFKNSTSQDYVSRAAKVVTLVDLAGHERYFKTTAYGLTGHLPDFACLLVGANAGVVGMCKEHLGVALALKVPVFFVVTKVDICPDHILKQSLQQLTSVLKRPGVKKRPFIVNTVQDVLTCALSITSESLAPIFLTSAVTGLGLSLLRLFVDLAPLRRRWGDVQGEPLEFMIDETFGVPGVGTVVAGTIKKGRLNLQTPLMLGPSIADGSFAPVAIKSIHYKRLPVPEAAAGQTAAVALKKVKRDTVRKGMVLVHRDVRPAASWEFDADISILTHATTIQPRYQAMIHCEIVRQAARVVAMDRERLRSGDRATVRFRFLQHPEYLSAGTRFVFREGRTKGIGIVVGTEAEEQKAADAAAEGKGGRGGTGA
eukprot:jgi/Ulvmu1/1952/UM012_0113.1